MGMTTSRTDVLVASPRRRLRGRSCPVLFLLAGVAILGCNQAKSEVAPPAPQEVVVAVPVYKEVSEYEEFTGRTQAENTVEIRAQVTGYLNKVNFRDGQEVNKGDVLFEIDPRTYEAALRQAESQVRLDEAQLKFAIADYERNRKLVGTGASSREDVEKSLAARDTAEASVQAAQADVARRKLDVEFCKVTALISGRASRRMVDPGNLIQANTTPLTTLVSLNPMYVYFDVDERTMLRVRRLIQEGKVKSARVATVPVWLGLSDEDGFPHEGIINFVDNQVDRTTGTLRLRGTFDNPDGILSPGLFARVRVQVGPPHQALLIPERALGTDQGQRFVFVVNDKNEVEYRRVQVGLLSNGLRVIENGLTEGERVIVDGLQRVRPGVTVKPRTEAPAPPVAGSK